MILGPDGNPLAQVPQESLESTPNVAHVHFLRGTVQVGSTTDPNDPDGASIYAIRVWMSPSEVFIIPGITQTLARQIARALLPAED